MSKNKENSMFGKKRSKLSVLPVIFSSVLAAGAITGAAVSIWHVSKNYQESSEFKKSYNARINVNPLAFEADAHKEDKDMAEANLKESAKRLSAWLKFNGAESYDVSYELTDKKTDKGYTESGWLSAHYTVNKVDKKHPTKDNDDKIDNDPYLSYFANGGFNTNNRTLVYRWYNPDSTLTTNLPRYTIFDFHDVFDIPTNLKAKDNSTKTLIDKDGNAGVLFKIKNNSVVNEVYKDLKQAFDDSKKEKESPLKNDFQKPRLYIINNMEQMFNEVHYHLLNYYINHDNYDYKNLYDNTEYAKFAKIVSDNTVDKKTKEGEQKYTLGKAFVCKNKEDTNPTKLDNGEALHFIDFTKFATIESSFLNKYVEKTYTYDGEGYKKFFPDKITDTYYNDVSDQTNPKINYAWYQTGSTTVSDKYLDQQVNYGLKCKVINIITSGETASDHFSAFKTTFASREVPPKFVDTIFGGNNLIGILSLGFLIYLIALAIILALLYRMTGFMSWICMMFMLSMSGLIAILGSGVISMSLLFGLFALSLAGFIAALAVCKRIKRRICSNEDTSVAVIKGLKQSLWPLADISFITLLFGICFTYVAPITLNPLGIMLIIGGFGLFVSMYLFNGLLLLLFFNNGLTMNKFQFIGKPNNKANEALAQSNSFVPSSLDATKLEFAFYDRMSVSKFGLINKPTLITICAFGALMIAGIIVFSVMGLTSSSLFHSSMCIVINSTTSPMAALSGLGLKYTSFANSGNWWYIYCDAVNNDMMTAIKTQFENAQFGNIVGNTNQDILNYAMLSILITVLSASVYTGIRSNWTAFVPMLAGSVLVPILMIGVASICQIKFDENVVLGFALATIFNTLISNTMVASINDAWFRKESYNNDELKFIVTVSAKNSITYLLLAALSMGLFIAAFAVTSPKGLGNVSWMMGIGGLVSIIVTPILVTYLLYWFLVIRAKALTKRANRLANKTVVNMDEIDEQAIEGINKFTKVKAYAKKPEQPQGETK